MFQFPALASYESRIVSLQDTGLSHSEISGSKVICTSPKLIAAYHVLHRLREPRHPPCALAYFLSSSGPKTGSLIYTFSLYFYFLYHHVKDRFPKEGRVENNGFEPLTLCVQGRCSSQLS